MTSIILHKPQDKLNVSNECSAPWDYQATLRFLWAKFRERLEVYE